MKKSLLSFGVVLLIAGSLLVIISSISIPRWNTFTVDTPQSELILNKAFEIQASGKTEYTLNLNKNDNLTINGAITEPESNRSIGAIIDFSINDSSKTYHSYAETQNITFSWTVPQSGNYSFVFDNTFGDASKDVIVMVMNNWREPKQYSMLVNIPLMNTLFTNNTPLVNYWFIWGGGALILIGIALAILWFTKKRVTVSQSSTNSCVVPQLKT